MINNSFLKDDGSFTIKDYNQTNPFSNFLPGIAGVWGVPIWVFYVNRGQGVISFGLDDKDHPIAEFYPANKAYSLTPTLGFRTFMKVNGKHYEPFRFTSHYKKQEEMVIKSDSFCIDEKNTKLGLEISVKYFTIPNTPVGALARVVSIKNISGKKLDLDILDGLPRIIPFGTNNFFLKEMARTLEAWMRAVVSGNLALFRLIVDATDVSQTKYIEGANFNCSFFEEKGKKVLPQLIVDPAVIFGQDISYNYPSEFYSSSFQVPSKQIDCGKTPCSFSSFNWKLQPGEEKVFYSVFGASFKSKLIKKFAGRLSGDFLKAKEEENKAIIDKVKNNAFCVSASKKFTNYLKSSYLDNVLRGGYPYTLSAKNGTYYIFSRKHGDLERDYNRFKLLPSYFSEGEANYRDINQNRRVDLFFNPFIERNNVNYFLNLVRIDGYNPLVVRGEKLFFDKATAKAILKKFGLKSKKLAPIMCNGFHLGEIFRFMEEEGIVLSARKEFAAELMEKAEREPVASFGEGFWIDHWSYNLDLVENFLYFYPDKTQDLFLAKEYLYWDDEHRVKERRARYQVKDGKVYQWNSVGRVTEKRATVEKRKSFKNFLRTKSGKIHKAHLIEKLLAFILNKSATLDPEGIGVEMEADKPGWCDSLNGLPALFGSSVCETFEVKRSCLLLIDALAKLKEQEVERVALSSEVCSFLYAIEELLKSYACADKKKRDYFWWDEANSIKEDFRNKTFYCISGEEKDVELDRLREILQMLVSKLDIGIKKAKDKKSSVYSTYFKYTVKKHCLKDGSIVPLEFAAEALPLFLEGPVHALRVEDSKNIYQMVKKSDLFDNKLKMYRLNASLKNEPLEVGRSRVFVPGWLENESIWLHMEYKYLLEILKQGLYADFFNEFHNCGVCFFDPHVYGRNILENSSFIVSSAHPDSNLWGKGFVARLSGATVEVVNMWIMMCLGRQPFFVDQDNNLGIKFAPILRSELFTTKKQTVNFRGADVVIANNAFAFALFSSVLVVYHNPLRKDTFKAGCKVKKITLSFKDTTVTVKGNTIPAPYSLSVRERKVDRIDLYLA